MEEDKQQSHEEKSSLVRGEENEKSITEDAETPPKNTGGWGWGFSVLSDLQKAAEEISRNVCF